MHYIVTHRNPNNAIRTDWVESRKETLGEVKEMAATARKYPGSLQIDSVVKVTAKGQTGITV